jgi:hypothetical protein
MLRADASALCSAAGESQACAAAAKDRIEVLEQEAESTAAEHQQAGEAAAAALKAAQEAAAQQLQEAQEAAAGQLQQASEQREAEVSKVQAELAAVKVSRHSCSTTAIRFVTWRCLCCCALSSGRAQRCSATSQVPPCYLFHCCCRVQAAAEAEVQQLQASLDSTNELLKKVMETATATEAEAAAAKEAMQKEVDTMKAKLAEAAGVLNAKEELREARWVTAYVSNGGR